MSFFINFAVFVRLSQFFCYAEGFHAHFGVPFPRVAQNPLNLTLGGPILDAIFVAFAFSLIPEIPIPKPKSPEVQKFSHLANPENKFRCATLPYPSSSDPYGVAPPNH